MAMANTLAADSASPLTSAEEWLHSLSRSTRSGQGRVFAIRLIQLAAQVATFWYFSQLVQSLVVAQQALSATQIAPFVGAVSLWAIGIWWADAVSHRTKFSIENQLEAQLHRLLREQQISVTRQYSSTYWQQLLMNHLGDVGDYLTQYHVQKWVAGIAPLVVLAVILTVNPVVALSLLVTLPVVPLFMILIGRGTAAVHRRHFVALERLGDLFSDRLKGLSLITATGQHPHQLERMDQASRIVNRKTMQVVSVAFLNTTVLDFFSTVAIALVAVFIGFTMLGELTWGPDISLHQGLFMLMVAPLLFAELRQLGRLYHQKARAEAGAERFAEVLQSARSGGAPQAQEEAAWINFRVRTPRLHATQLTVGRGDWIRLSGASGSGKTSLLEALMGFRPASHSLGGEIAMLTQKACVLDKTLAFNLHLGHEGYSDDQLMTVLDEVGLLDWFQSLPEGLETRMGDGPAMSGGEAQRLALARILLLGKDRVLLDEPTAHLTEAQHVELAELIHRKLRDKTVIWSSHKPLPAAWFNQHWRIKNGEIEVIS